jgi:hypothetical protein
LTGWLRVMVDTPLADMGRGRRPWSVAPSWLAHLLGVQMTDLQGVVAGDRPDQLALVEDLQQGWFHPGDHGLTGQVPANRQPLVGDPDAAIAADDPGHLGRADRRWLWAGGPRSCQGRAALAMGLQPDAEPLRWVVMPSAWCGRVVWSPVTQTSSIGWASARCWKRCPVNSSIRKVLWKRSILPVVVGFGPGTQMGDALLAADAVEQHLGRVRTEPTGEHLAVVGEDLVGTP